MADKPPVFFVFWPINPRYCTRIFVPPWFRPTLMARKVLACYVSPPRAPVTSKSLGTALLSGGSCQGILVKIHPQGKQDPTSGQKKNSDVKQKYLCEPVMRSRVLETRDYRGGLWRRFCRMKTSFLTPSCQINTTKLPGYSITNSGSQAIASFPKKPFFPT